VLDKLHPHRAAIEAALVERERSLFNLDRRSITMTSPRLTLKARLQISEFPAGDFGGKRQAVSVETDRPFRSKAAPHPGGVWAPASANHRCGTDAILCGSGKASTFVYIVDFGSGGGQVWIM